MYTTVELKWQCCSGSLIGTLVSGARRDKRVEYSIVTAECFLGTRVGGV